MKAAALIAVVALAVGAAAAGAAGRYRPAAPDFVVLQVPARALNDPIVLLEQQQKRAPEDQSIAASLAALYVERARKDREQRYFGRAEVLLQPWLLRADVSGATLRVQADILQNRHEFAGAVELLDRAIEQNSRDAGARLMRASVALVQGRAADARTDCAAVLASGESAAGTVCFAQVLGASGQLAQAEGLLKTLLVRDESLPPAVRGWALWLMADFADRRGDALAAERSLRAALAATPTNEGVRSALIDVLLARGAAREALSLTVLRGPSVGLLARRAYAQEVLNDPALAETRAQIDDLLSLAVRRGERPHLREEALLALDVERNADRALELAKANFAVQRETIDVRLLVRAARARGDTATLAEVADWVRTTRFEDRTLAGLRT